MLLAELHYLPLCDSLLKISGSLLVMCGCIYVCVLVCDVSSGAHGGQKGQIPLQLELQAVASSLMWVLEVTLHPP